MSEFFGGVIVLGALAVIMALLALLARWVRRRGDSGQAFAAGMAAFNEAWHGSAHDSYVEVQARQERKHEVGDSDKR